MGACDFDFDATDVVRNVWIVGEEADELAGSKTILADGIVVIKGNDGIEMSFDKSYEFGVTLRACLESRKIRLEKAENVVEDVVGK